MSNTMREILFRGKRVDNGEWIEGYLVKKVDPIYVDIKYYFILHQEKDNLGCLMSFTSWDKIDPKTVGQFTGLTDKNGNKIFEGDIVKHYNHKSNMMLFDIGLVFWDVNKCRFVRTSKDNDSVYEIRRSCMNDYEIISNIHDNPELLEESNV